MWAAERRMTTMLDLQQLGSTLEYSLGTDNSSNHPVDLYNWPARESRRSLNIAFDF